MVLNLEKKLQKKLFQPCNARSIVTTQNLSSTFFKYFPFGYAISRHSKIAYLRSFSLN